MLQNVPCKKSYGNKTLQVNTSQEKEVLKDMDMEESHHGRQFVRFW